MEAIRRGKHVYCEKPLTHSIFEAHLLTKAAREYGIATQTGNQGQASEQTRVICEYIWDGAIGQVHEVHVWAERPLRGINDVYWPQGIGRPTDTPPIPHYLDWHLWLGPAPYRPYHPAYLPFRWRGWWDFGTGALGDMGSHLFDTVFRALKLGHPTSIEATSTPVNKETYPLSSIINYQFPARNDMSQVKLTWYDGGLKPDQPDEMNEGEELGSNGILFIGDDGKMLNDKLIPESKGLEYGKPPKFIPRSPGHYIEWINACKGGEPAGSNFDWAGPLTEVLLLGNIALRPELKDVLIDTKLIWDSEKMEFTNVPQANDFLRYKYYRDWTFYWHNDFLSFADFALSWHNKNCGLENNNCNGGDLNGDGYVDWTDLKYFVANWLYLK
jgi:predicted dehydrogenase